MDLAIESNRNSALFNTMMEVLDVYNPLIHKARPTVVNQTKHRIRVQPTRWGNTMDKWSGQQSVRFDLPRIGSLVDFALKMAFRIPGDAPNPGQRVVTGDRGFAKATLTSGGLVNTDTTGNTARGRLDRLYADRLLGFNMIESYTIMSKSREIFSASGEYLLVRFSTMDDDMKRSIMESITPVDIMSPDVDNTFYSPGVTYVLNIPLFMFFNEHITSALDVNFSEEVHIDIKLRPASHLFYYGQLGDMTQRNTAAQAIFPMGSRIQAYEDTTLPLTTNAGSATWDQSTKLHGTQISATTNLTFTTTTGTFTTTAGDMPLSGIFKHNNTSDSIIHYGRFTRVGDVFSMTPFPGEVFTALSIASKAYLFDAYHDASTVPAVLLNSEINIMQQAALKHIQGIGAPLDVWGSAYGDHISTCVSGPTFAFHDSDNNGETMLAQFEANADFIVQDTDVYRELRAASFPEGSGLTTITYDTSQEHLPNLMTAATGNTLLSSTRGGSFVDPANSSTGINIGNSTRFVDLPIRSNHLVMATHFMVRKHSDLGGSNNTDADPAVTTGLGVPLIGSLATTNTLGAHRIYTRCLPVHYFQFLAAGRVIYESDGDSQLKLTQSQLYNGTGLEWGSKSSSGLNRNINQIDRSATAARPFNIYSINWGLQASRLENSGCLSLQNLNNPTLRIYFKAEEWNEYSPLANLSTSKDSNAKTAADLGVVVDIIHEHFNVITINSGNGEITSGLNQ
jgi:hypothetical protein